MPAFHSVCPLDCPDRCSLEVKVENGRVASITGSRVNPLTDGFICAKVRDYPRRVYGPDRLLHPMRRTGAKGEGRFERISWDEAIATIAGTFETIRREHGGEAILPFSYGGSNGLLTQGTTDERLFRSIGASRLARTVCAAPTGAAAEALYGRMASIDFPDFAKARFIVIWGANPKHSNIHLMPYLKAAREAGGRVALIDPRLTMSSHYVDMHLPVFPGTDGAVALAMIGHLERTGRVDRAFLEKHTTGWEKLLERARAWTPERAAAVARVEARDITAIAEAYAAADPALIRCGWGLERNRNSEPSVAAVLALPAVAGKFGRPGGGYALSSSPAYQVDDDRLAGVPEAKTRVINMNRLGRALLEEARPPVKALFVYDCNPLVTVPDQNRIRRGLLRDDLFTVVFDQVKTDTALYADVLLPATTFLEHTELSTSYGTYAVMLGEPVIEPAGQARPNEEVFGLILERMGTADRRPRGEALLREALAAIGGPLAGGGRNAGAAGAARSDARDAASTGAARLERLRRDRFLPFDFPGPLPVQFGTVFPGTPGRKADLWPEALGPDPYLFLDDPGSERHPLALISPATDRTISSTLGEFNHADVRLEMHPRDAAARRLADGQEVRAHNDLGEVRVRLRINPEVRPGVVFLPKGIWNRHTLNGCVGTALVPDTVSAVSGGACFNDARVEVGPGGQEIGMREEIRS
jgi:anaerobic selenocysteine-containing dehydrogenase